MRRKRSVEAGFSLIEVLIAVLVFIVGLLAIADTQVNSIGHNARSNTRSVATSIAMGVLEQALSFDESNPLFRSTTAGMVWDLDPDTAATSLDVPGAGTYNATWDVVTNTPVNRLAQVVVTVSGPRGLSITLTGYKRFI